jgi:hypothetical protein
MWVNGEQRGRLVGRPIEEVSGMEVMSSGGGVVCRRGVESGGHEQQR